MTTTAALALCRLARDGGALVAWGCSLYVAVLAPVAIRPTLAQKVAFGLRLAVLALAIALAALLPIEAADLGAGWVDALDPGTIHALLFETTIGTAWFAQASAAVALAIAVALPRPWTFRAAVPASACLLASLTLSGHAAMHEGILGAMHRFNALAHLVAAGFWLGALVPLVPTLTLLGDPDRHRAAGIALHRFSTLGHAAVAVVIATGALNTTLILHRWPTDLASPYQALLVAKIGVVGTMTALAIANRYLVVPRLREAPAGAVRAIRFVTLLEVALGFAAIALVAVFGQLEPI